MLELVVVTGMAARQLVAILSEEGSGWPGPFGLVDRYRAFLWNAKLKGSRPVRELAHGLLCPMCAGFYYSVALLALRLANETMWAVVSIPLAAWSIVSLWKQPENPPDDSDTA